MKKPVTYILANKIHGTLYIGVTSDLIKRVWQHKQKSEKGFTKKYNIEKLVYYEMHATMEEAIAREKRVKKWNREWKIELIEKYNYEWRDLYNEIT